MNQVIPGKSVPTPWSAAALGGKIVARAASP